MKYEVLFIIILLNFMIAGCQSFSSDQEENHIRQVMKQQVTSWNNGDLRGFMNGYWSSDSLRFIGSKGIQYGWETTLNNYLNTYDSPEQMGTLEFNIIAIEVMGNKAYVLGQWNIDRSSSPPIGGYFTLFWKKINGEWKIVIDHTS